MQSVMVWVVEVNGLTVGGHGLVNQGSVRPYNPYRLCIEFPVGFWVTAIPLTKKKTQLGTTIFDFGWHGEGESEM